MASHAQIVARVRRALAQADALDRRSSQHRWAAADGMAQLAHLGWTQSLIAERVGLNQPAVSRYLRAAREYSDRNARPSWAQAWITSDPSASTAGVRARAVRAALRDHPDEIAAAFAELPVQVRIDLAAQLVLIANPGGAEADEPSVRSKPQSGDPDPAAVLRPLRKALRLATEAVMLDVPYGPDDRDRVLAYLARIIRDLAVLRALVEHDGPVGTFEPPPAPRRGSIPGLTARERRWVLNQVHPDHHGGDARAQAVTAWILAQSDRPTW